MTIRDVRAAGVFVGWLLGFLVALAASGWMFLADNDALAQADALDAGTTETVTARLEVHLDDHRRTRLGKPDRDGADEWLARCRSDDPGLDLDDGPAFDVPGRGEILHRWDGATVTCHLWEDEVIAVGLPDGTLVRGEQVGWRGLVARWCSGVFAFGAALLIGGARLRMGVLTGVAGGVLTAGTGLVGIHLAWPWVGLAIDLVVLGVGGYLLSRRGRVQRCGAG